ncbi:MAG: glycosyltransferase [Bacteroidia bacterium]
MRILHINTFDRGGAFNAALRLHEGLIAKNVNSHLLILNKSTTQPIENSSVYVTENVKRKNLPERIIRKVYNSVSRFYPDKDTLEHKQIHEKINSRQIEWFSFPDTGIDITDHPEYKKADVINLHWVADFVDYSFLAKNIKPVVWTLHDMAPFTGGCHYSEGCRLFMSDCNVCPILNGTIDPSITKRSFIYKSKIIADAKNLNLVSPSLWLLNESKQSELFKNFKHYHIPNGIDSSRFKRHDKNSAREALGLPKDKCVLLFVAFHNQNIKRKGFIFLHDALNLLNNDSLFICSVGNADPDTNPQNGIIDLGLIKDENKMSMIYSAADVFVIPSIEDNLPNTVIESLMCGTPVIGYAVGGITDMVKNNENGLLCDEISSRALAETINLFLEKRNDFNSDTIRNDTIERYDISVQTKFYIELYLHLCNYPK